MISGIGIDIVEISRLKQALARHPDTFSTKVFTDQELALAGKRSDPNPFLAGRWAAKEALAKALGCGLGPDCGWTEIEVVNQQNGRPEMKLLGRAAQFAATRGVSNIQVSISHEKHYACAVVVLES